MIREVLLILTGYSASVHVSCDFVFDELHCRSLKLDALSFTECAVTRVQPIGSAIGFRVAVHVPLDNIVVYANITRRGQERRRLLFQQTIDMCDFMLHKSKYPVANLLHKMVALDKHSNFNHSCPYDHDLIFPSYRFNMKYIDMLPVPPGLYTVTSVWSISKIPHAVIVLKFHFTP